MLQSQSQLRMDCEEADLENHARICQAHDWQETPADRLHRWHKRYRHMKCHDLGAQIAKTAYAEGRTLKEVALEKTELSEEELDKILDPLKLTL